MSLYMTVGYVVFVNVYFHSLTHQRLYDKELKVTNDFEKVVTRNSRHSSNGIKSYLSLAIPYIPSPRAVHQKVGSLPL